MRLTVDFHTITIDLSENKVRRIYQILESSHLYILIFFLSSLSVFFWLYFSSNGLHLSYNDAMSHLDIGRRVVDNLKPGLTQLGSVWLPLLHILMLPTIWIDFFWRSGLSAGIISMISFILTALFTYKTIRLIGCNMYQAVVGAGVVAINPNFLYLQTTALTEPLFMVLSTIACFYLVKWAKTLASLNIIIAAFFILLSTLTRYDGWFLLIFATVGVFIPVLISKGWHVAKGHAIIFGTLAGFGVVLWLLYNQVIFGDAFYFALSEYSAKAQQDRMFAAGDLPTKGNIIFSLITYYYSMVSNIGFFAFLFACAGWIYFMARNKNIYMRIIGIVFLAPLIFNVLSLYLGHSVIYLPETVGNSWFNVRYGIIVLPWAGVFIGYLLMSKSLMLKFFIPTIIIFQSASFVSSNYVITIIDGKIGASQKNVRRIGEQINKYAGGRQGLILASAASHDAILFSSGIPMKRYIHEGTAEIWRDSLKYPDRYATFVVMRTNDNTDLVSRAMSKVGNFSKNYSLVYDGDFADIYQKVDLMPPKKLSSKLQ